MKNDTFNISRFALVVKKDLQENWKKNLISVLTLFGVMLITYMWSSIDNYSTDVNSPSYSISMEDFVKHINKQYTLFAVLLFTAAFPVYISMMMDPMSSKKRRTQYLMLPASSLEKFLSRFLQYTVGFLVIFFASFYLADFIRVAICTPIYTQMDVRAIDLGVMIGNNNHSAMFYNLDHFLIAISYFTLILSLFILGTTFWQKNVFIKNFVASTLLLIVVVLVIAVLMNMLSDRAEMYWNVFLHPKQFFSPDNLVLIVSITILFSIFNCVLSYFRFKESEFIQRW